MFLLILARPFSMLFSRSADDHAADGDAARPSTRSRLGRLRRDPGLLVLLLLMLASLPFVTQRIYASDEIKYFAYLHSLFFDQDLDFTNDYEYWSKLDDEKYGALVESMLKPNPNTGLPINEAPIGSALLWSPFYLLGHLYALVAGALGSDVPANGFSQPYITAVCYASFFYGWAGLLLGYRLLRRLFEPFVAALAIIAAWLATPAVVYMVIAPPWSHSASLFAVTLFLSVWYFTRPAARRTPGQWALLGLSAGLMMMVREQDALFLAIPAVETLLSLWPPWERVLAPEPPAPHRPAVGARASSIVARPAAGGLGDFIARYRSQVIGWVICFVCTVLAFTPQFLVYRVTNGTFRPSSTVGEKLTWWSPHFFEVLFSPAYGLIPWTPLLIPALVGLVLLARKDRTMAVAFLLAFVAQVFIAGAFLTWMGASSFGQRRFINATVIFAFGVAALAAWLLEKGLSRRTVSILAGLFVAWNAGLVVQYALMTSAERERGLVWPDVIVDQFRVMIELPQIVWRFLFNRGSFMSPTAPE